jgi:deoxyribodipyrimidine photo-lyase
MMDRMKATRAVGLEKLEQFLPHAGIDYAQGRNHVPGVVSGLSPYIRHRLITEEEVVAAVLGRHSEQAAEKFIQEVCWRTYWKGWLEMRPSVWFRYLDDLRSLHDRMEKEPDFEKRVRRTEQGETGIECLDDWARELRKTGYLHNHVRMWFASIWVHTLRLPWQLGADFFMRHLLDGDPASNTLSWRWVCGLQTKGKVYVATADNIERYTNGRYAPHGLVTGDTQPATEEFLIPQPLELIRPDRTAPGERTLLLVTDEDLFPESWGIPRRDVAGVVLVDTAEASDGVGSLPVAWRRNAIDGSAQRLEAEFQSPIVKIHRLEGEGESIPARLQALLRDQGAISLSMMTPPVGPTLSLIEPILRELSKAGVTVRKLRRSWDDAFWPHATHGFFKLKERIPPVLKELF